MSRGKCPWRFHRALISYSARLLIACFVRLGCVADHERNGAACT